MKNERIFISEVNYPFKCVELCTAVSPTQNIYLYICFSSTILKKKKKGKAETEANEMCDERNIVNQRKVWRKPGKGQRQQNIDESESGERGPSGHFPRT